MDEDIFRQESLYARPLADLRFIATYAAVGFEVPRHLAPIGSVFQTNPLQEVTTESDEETVCRFYRQGCIPSRDVAKNMGCVVAP